MTINAQVYTTICTIGLNNILYHANDPEVILFVTELASTLLHDTMKSKVVILIVSFAEQEYIQEKWNGASFPNPTNVGRIKIYVP